MKKKKPNKMMAAWLQKEKERVATGNVPVVEIPAPPVKRAGGGKVNDAGDRILTMADIPPLFKKVCPPTQIAAILGSEEHFEILARIEKDIEALRAKKGSNKEDPICYLHYFDKGSTDMWVYDWRGGDTMDAFVCLNGDGQMAERGPISLQEIFPITQKVRVSGSVSGTINIPAIELDFFWTPKPVSEIEELVREGKRVPSGPIRKPAADEIPAQKLPTITQAAPQVDRLKTAEELGKKAFLNDKKRVPAQDSALANMLNDGRKIGDPETIPLLDAWLSGYDIAQSLPQPEEIAAEEQQQKLKEWEKRLAFIKRIEALIDKNGVQRNRYSAQDLADMRNYDGWGGLATKLRGSNEFKTTEILEEFYTPYEIIEKMWGLAYLYGFDASKVNNILEPACGIGKMLEYVPPNQNVDAYEISKYSYAICKLTLPPHFNFYNESFETLFFKGDMHLGMAAVHKRYNLILSNPPFSSYTSPYAKIKGPDGLTEAQETGAKTFDQYFLMRGVDLLEQGGLLLYVMPATFMNNDDAYNDFKEALLRKANLIDAYRLPSIHPHTAIGWDLLVFKKL